MVSFHVLLLDRAGNNLVNADFSLYLGHIFTVKHIYLTLYIVYMCRIAPIYSAPLYLLALLAVPCCSLCCSRPPARSVPAARRPCGSLRCSLARLCARCARLPVPVCASADAWSTVDFFVRRPRVACLACPLSVCVGAVRLPSSRLPCILFAYNVHSPPLCQACPPRFRPPQTFSRSFAGGRYLSRCRRCGRMTRLDVAIRGDLGAL